MLKRIIILTATIILFLSNKVGAVTCDITVTPGQSIQSAINRANNSSTVCVQYGTYHESIDINKPGLKVIGIANNQNQIPVIDGEYTLPIGTRAHPTLCPGRIRGKDGNLHDCFDSVWPPLVHLAESNTSFENFKVTRSLGRGVSVHNEQKSISGAIVKNNIITVNRRTGLLFLKNVKSSKALNNTISYNANFAPFSRDASILNHPGGGITMVGVDGIEITGNIVAMNWGEGIIGDGNVGGSKNIIVNKNHVYDNYALQVYPHAVQNFQVTNNFIYHSTNPEFFRGVTTPSNCLVVNPLESQIDKADISTDNVLIKNNIIAGCKNNINNWGGNNDRLITNLEVSNNTLYTKSNSNVLTNYGLATSKLSNPIFKNNISIGPKGNNSFGGDTIFANESAAGLNPNLVINRGMSPTSFVVSNSGGKGANIDLIPDVNQVGASANYTEPTPTPSTQEPTPTVSEPTPTPSVTPLNKYDVTENGVVDLLDIIEVIKYLFN